MSSSPSACRSHIHISPSRAARSSCSVCRFLWRTDIVLTCTFGRVGSALAWRSDRQRRIGEFRSSGQVLFETFRVCRIGFHPSGDPGSALFCVFGCPITKQPLQPKVAPDSDTTFFMMFMRLPFFFIYGFVTVGPASTSEFTIRMYLAGAARLGSTSTRPPCKLQELPIPSNS